MNTWWLIIPLTMVIIGSAWFYLILTNIGANTDSENAVSGKFWIAAAIVAAFTATGLTWAWVIVS